MTASQITGTAITVFLIIVAAILSYIGIFEWGWFLALAFCSGFATVIAFVELY